LRFYDLPGLVELVHPTLIESTDATGAVKK